MRKYSETNRKEIISVPGDKKIRFDVCMDNGSFTPSHWHEALEVIYVLDGTAVVTSFGTSVTLRPGQFTLINSHQVHASRCPSENRTILMQVPDDFLNSYLPDYSDVWFSLPSRNNTSGREEQLDELERLLLSMKDLQENGRPGWLLSFTSQLFSFLAVLFEHFAGQAPAEYPPSDSRVFTRLDAVVTYTQEHYATPISLKDAARAAALQPEYFCRFFRQHMGMTYLQYLNDYRLSRVYRDLIITDLSVGALEELHGFTNDKLFHRLFKEKFHTTPLQLRKAQRPVK